MQRLTKEPKVYIGLLGLVAVVSIAATGVRYYQQDSAIPTPILRKASFPVMEPDKKIYIINKGSPTYNADEGVLTYKVKGNNTEFTVTQQQIPDSFSDVPQLYPALLNKMRQYAEIRTNAGTVTLTHPEELKGDQTAVMKSSRGVLVFVRPKRNISEGEWKHFFNSLEVSK